MLQATCFFRRMLQGEFAKELDVSRSSLANWEQGRFIPSRDNYNILKKYAEERGLSLDES
ncbi:MAG: helix-turn-helix transcriptional regulator [Butyrivibrio sp.]|nr:helix-turn-helix transcriptional regulator [Butyrivibrio sp.]